MYNIIQYITKYTVDTLDAIWGYTHRISEYVEQWRRSNDMESKTDLRVIKTKKAIRSAFYELVKKKNIDDISISEIASLAMIDRKTFYAHYAGVHALINEIEDEIVKTVGVLVYDIDAYDFFSNPKQIMHVLETITESETFSIARALSQGRNAMLLNKFVNSIKSEVIEELQAKTTISEQQLSIVVDYTITGIISCYQNWLRNGRPIPLETLSEELSRIVVLGLNGISR